MQKSFGQRYTRYAVLIVFTWVEALKDGTQKTHASLNGITRIYIFSWIDSLYCIVSQFLRKCKDLAHLLTREEKKSRLAIFKHTLGYIRLVGNNVAQNTIEEQCLIFDIGHRCEER